MATRFHLPSANAPPVSPAFQSYTHAASTTRRNLVVASDGSALGTVAQTPDGADHLVAGDTFHVQFVSAPLAAQTFTTGDVYKYAILGNEANAANNLFIQVWMGIYTNDGGTLKATIRSKDADNTEMATAGTSRFQSSTLSGTYTCLTGERLVIEFSVTGTPTAAGGVQGHNASIRWGTAGAGGDLLENDSQTTSTTNGWLEFANTITFATRGLLSWAELQTPFVPTRGRLSWAELETPLAPTRGRVAWAEFQVPLAPTRGRMSWAELEVPAVAATPTRGLVAWSELEVPFVGTRGLLAWNELEVPAYGGAATEGSTLATAAAGHRGHCWWNYQGYVHVRQADDGTWLYRKVGSWLDVERPTT